MKKIFFLYVLLPAFACTHFNEDNPYLSSYTGHYSLKVKWPSDTMVLFREYDLPCTTGVDTFLQVKVPDSLEKYIDTSLLKTTALNDPGAILLRCAFVAPFESTFTIEGLPPNMTRPISDSARLTVVNPFTIDAPETLALEGDLNADVAIRSSQDSFPDTLRIRWQLDKTQPETLSIGKAFSRKVTVSGKSVINATVLDKQYSYALHPRDLEVIGKPVVSIDSVDTSLGNIFVNDLRIFYVSALDPDTTVRMLYFNCDTGDRSIDSFPENAQSVNQSFLVRYSITQSGPHSLSAWARNIEGTYSDTAHLQITVRLGKPVLDSISPHTVWVNDDTLFRFFLRDTNGTVDMAKVEWGDGKADSFAVASNPDTGLHHRYPIIDKDSSYTVKTILTDNDNVSDTILKKVLVKLGRPKVWIDGHADTLFIPVVNAGKYTLSVHSADSNGTVVKFFWAFSEPFTIDNSDSTTDSSISHFISANDINTGYMMAVFGRDDDGIACEDSFWLYPDGAPVKPALLKPDSAAVDSGPVTFKWKNQDVRDKLQTQFKIMYWKGITTPAAVDGMDFTMGSDTAFHFNAADSSFSYVATGLPRGTIDWFVIAQDRLGSQTVSDTLYFDH